MRYLCVSHYSYSWEDSSGTIVGLDRSKTTQFVRQNVTCMAQNSGVNPSHTELRVLL
jgi:hypothetical protein